MIQDDDPSVELKVKVININLKENHEVLERCQVLKEYSSFIDTIRKYQDMEVSDPYHMAIDECIKNNILADYLKKNGSEVVNMLMSEYNYEQDIEVQREESREEGRKEADHRYSQLILKLAEENKTDWILKIATDPEFREKLYKEYNIK